MTIPIFIEEWDDAFGCCPVCDSVDVVGAVEVTVCHKTVTIICECGKSHALQGDEKCEFHCSCGQWIEQI